MGQSMFRQSVTEGMNEMDTSVWLSTAYLMSITDTDGRVLWIQPWGKEGVRPNQDGVNFFEARSLRTPGNTLVSNPSIRWTRLSARIDPGLGKFKLPNN